MNFFQSIYYLFFPEVCVFCQDHLSQHETVLCTSCRHHLPMTDFVNTPNNMVEKSFEGRIPIVAGTALLYFNKKGISQELIHHLKYKKRQDIGVFFGDWMGKQLKESFRFRTIDAIVLVPLHPKKLKSRGYNQLTTFGIQLAKEMDVPIIKNALLKIIDSSSQTKKDRQSRFQKIRGSFLLGEEELLKKKHILLLDDVITTGATLEACAKTLLSVEGVRVSVATMVAADNL